MRRQEINYKKVAIAAEKIKKRGKEPSLTDICEELGIVGNFPELNALLEQWYHHQPEFKRSVHAPLTENLNVARIKSLKKILSLKNPYLY